MYVMVEVRYDVNEVLSIKRNNVFIIFQNVRTCTID